MHAKKMKTKRHYTTPVTQQATVELEGGGCGSVIEDNDGKSAKVVSTAQEYESFDANAYGGEGDNTAVISWE